MRRIHATEKREIKRENMAHAFAKPRKRKLLRKRPILDNKIEKF
jgi:hypothetical protein